MPDEMNTKKLKILALVVVFMARSRCGTKHDPYPLQGGGGDLSNTIAKNFPAQN